MIKLSELTFLGKNLNRPECVLAHSDGTIHVSDWRGGVTVIYPDGGQKTILSNSEFKPKTNGISIHSEGGWLITHLGESTGGVFRLFDSGQLYPFLEEVDGISLPPTNYVHRDLYDRIWITVSTRTIPRHLNSHAGCDDGFIILVDEKGARIVADGLGFANECIYHHQSKKLYVNETFTRKLTVFNVSRSGQLSNKETLTEFGHGTYPDGLTFDAVGSIWVTSIVSNRIIKVFEDGSYDIILEDSDDNHIEITEKAYLAQNLNRELLNKNAGSKLQNISSLAFGGADLRTIYIGNILGHSIASFRTDQVGLAPSHWENRQNL